MIRFFVAEGGRVLRHKRLVRQWLDEILFEAGFKSADLNYIFCGDEYLYRLNKEFLNHDTYTDIITFSESISGVISQNKIAGECYISTDRVAENAVLLKVGYTEELHRVMAHGLFHLLGQGDKTRQEKAAMRHLENTALQKRNFGQEKPGSVAGQEPDRRAKGARHAAAQSAGDGGGNKNKKAGSVFHVEQQGAGPAFANKGEGRLSARNTGGLGGSKNKKAESVFHVERASRASKNAADGRT